MEKTKKIDLYVNFYTVLIGREILKKDIKPDEFTDDNLSGVIGIKNEDGTI